ncbi:MAG: hypothetical protein P8177_12490 [Gemmatimonadota bacterium]|jgi:hypothetical protein
MLGFFVFIMTLVAGVLALVGGLRWLRLDGRELQSGDGVGPERLDRVETALEALEARLDELQDQQRFLERLLSERQEAPALPPERPSAETESGEAPQSILFDPELRPRGEGS